MPFTDQITQPEMFKFILDGLMVAAIFRIEGG
jgi:hypothetical protein